MTAVAHQALTDMIPKMIVEQGQAFLRMYGSSMAPILTAGKIVRVVSINGSPLQIGDIVCFRKNGGLVAHRVVKVEFNPVSGQTRILCKGDNRKVLDPPLSLKEIFGKVTAIEDSLITTGFWRKVNFLTATLSYWEAVIHQKKSQSKLWLFLHRLKKVAGIRQPLDFISPVALGIPSGLIKWVSSCLCTGKKRVGRN